MGQLVLLVVAAAWAAVLIPPLLRSRIENRPNSSVTDFRNQLSSLQRAMPSRGVAMRSMARPLAPSPLSRPAAPGRPPLRSGVRTHGGGTTRSASQQSIHRVARHDGARLYDATPRARTHGGRPADPRTASRQPASVQVSSRDAVKRRRANVLFVLALIAACSLFLAATTKAEAMLYVFGVAFLALCGYVYVLGQMRQREQRPPVEAVAPVVRSVPHHSQRRTEVRRPAHRAPARRHPDRWSHAV